MLLKINFLFLMKDSIFGLPIFMTPVNMMKTEIPQAADSIIPTPDVIPRDTV